MEAADEAFSAFATYKTETIDADVREGMKFRIGQKARDLNLSYADSIGYAISLRLGAQFLTGDPAFRGIDQVEFVG